MKTKNHYEIKGDVTKVFLSNCDDYFICDTADIVKILDGHTWRRDKDGYAVATINSKHISLHLFLMGKQAGLEIDHKNRNKLDNRRENLRRVTHAVNVKNRDIVYTETVGVQKNQNGKRYKAFIHYMSHTIYLGTFDTQAEAIRARKEAEIFYWGKQA